MTNFIFKSQGTFKKISNKLDIIQNKLRHQRADNVQILFLLNKILVDKNLTEQATKYFEEDAEEPIEDYTHQTKVDTKDWPEPE